jgi:hypothetical protein
MNDKNRKRLHKLLAALPAAALLVTGFAGSMLQPQQAWSDDRDLLGSGGEKPYVFFLIDISSSMLRMISTAANGAYLPGGLDDPEGKIYIAKKAVYEVVQQVGNNALYGFATYDTNNVQMNDKHWAYTLQSNPSWFSSEADFSGGSATRPWQGAGSDDMAFPRVGHPLIFGDHSHGDNDLETPEGNTNHDDGSCAFPENLDVTGTIRGEMRDIWTDVEGLGKLMTFSKLGREGSFTTTQWFLYKGEKYRLIWYALSGGQSLGDVPLNVEVDFQRLSNGDCGSPAYDDIAMNETLVLVPLHPTDLDGDPLPGPPSSMGGRGSGSGPWRLRPRRRHPLRLDKPRLHRGQPPGDPATAGPLDPPRPAPRLPGGALPQGIRFRERQHPRAQGRLCRLSPHHHQWRHPHRRLGLPLSPVVRQVD